MMNNVKSLLVVGGGTAGLVAALILKKRLDIQVDLVYSKSIGIIGVGEGSTEHFREFMEFVGINQYDLIKECDATYKCGIMFEGWGDKDYLHCVIPPYNKKTAQYSTIYGHQIANNSSYVTPEIPWHNRVNRWFVNRPEEFPYNQFHFNTHKLNKFLFDIASAAGIRIIEDEINDIVLDDNGYIKYLTGSKQQYQYDFYIDSTGFKRPLMEKLGAKWNSFGKYLKMKAAVVFPTGDEDNYNIWTLAKAMDYGWMFRIPVWGRHGNGYIFDSDYTNFDQAKAEVEKLFGREIDFGKEFKFDPGCLDRAWINNCCAVGLSGSFVEPLEATSIGTSIQQSFLLMHKLINYDQKVIDSYNKSFTDVMENIRDFIVLHYVTNKTNTQFWKDISSIELPDTLKSKLDIWKNKLPIEEDFSELSDYKLFGVDNYTLVLEGLNLFNRDAIKKEFESNPSYIKYAAQQEIEKQLQFEKSVDTITHKKLLELIRENF